MIVGCKERVLFLPRARLRQFDGSRDLHRSPGRAVELGRPFFIFETPPRGRLVGSDDVSVGSFRPWGVVGVVLRRRLGLRKGSDWQ
jgi:hypothetical protein